MLSTGVLGQLAFGIAIVMLVLDGVVVVPFVVAYLRRRHRQQIGARLPVLTVVIVLALQVKVTHDLLMIVTGDRYLDCYSQSTMVVLTFLATATFNLRAALLYWSYRLTRARMIVAAAPLQPTTPTSNASKATAVPVVAIGPSPVFDAIAPVSTTATTDVVPKKTPQGLSKSDQWFLKRPGLTGGSSIARIMYANIAVHIVILLGAFVDVTRHPQTPSQRCSASVAYTAFMFLWTMALLAQQIYYVSRIRVVVDVFQIRPELVRVWYSSMALLVIYLIPPLVTFSSTVFPVVPLAYWAIHKFQVAVQIIQPVYRVARDVDDDEFIRKQERPPVADVIETAEGAAALTAFMATEFAVESPLFLIAVRDFKRMFPKRAKARPNQAGGEPAPGSSYSPGSVALRSMRGESLTALTDEPSDSARGQVPDAVIDAALSIFETYVKSDAPLQVNISSAAYNSIVAAVQEPGRLPTRDIFDSAVTDVLALFKGGPVARFWASEHGRRLLVIG